MIRPEISGDWNLEAWKGFRQALRDCCFVDIMCERLQNLRMRKENKTVTKAELIVLTNDFRWAFDEDMDELMSEANEMFGLRADRTRPEFYVDGACSFLSHEYDSEKRKESFDPRISTFAPRQRDSDSCHFIGANDEIDYARICGRNIFDQSTMFHIDALHSTDAGLRFIDFVEALCRLSELLLICADKRPVALKLNDTWNEFFRPLLDIEQSPNRLMAEAIEAFVVLHVGSVSEQRTRRMAFHSAHLSDVQVRIQKARQIIRRNALARRNWSKLITPIVRKGRCLYGKEVFKLTEFGVEEIECAHPPGLSIERSQLPFWMRNLK